ncbi:NnrS family protein [Pusillimonas sp. NJUB218]|uniref:NnrS family protein n=1 Tax=Pusillimonas sp. NJUB218 TaxID=2023230 RepID=UPI0018F4C3A6|nr:NnrS family protein [Pusillimonas sp. NJUB218]
MPEIFNIAEPAQKGRGRPSWDALLEMGFRPLYPAGVLWALVSVALWVYAPGLLSPRIGVLAWHAHEMLWGFIATIAVGFLLTAAATWTGINPLKGKPLALLFGLWLVARLAYLGSTTIWLAIAVVAETLFFAIAALALWRVIGKTQSRRNYGVPWLAMGLAIANLLYIHAAWLGDYNALMTAFNIGLVDMAVIALLVARRVIPFFAMRAINGLELPMHIGTGQLQLGLGLFAIAAGLVGLPRIMAIALALTGLISLYQLFSWKPVAVRSKPILWILYIGYAFMGLGLITAGAWLLDLTPGALTRAAVPAHIIGMGGFSVLIIGMVTRTALGHLGRPLLLDRSMVASYGFMLAAVCLRLAALWPSSLAPGLLHLAAACWVVSLALYLWRFVPWLIRPRFNAEPMAATTVNLRAAASPRRPS